MRGKLRQPGRCVHSECLYYCVSSGTAAQLTQRFQHRVVRFFASIAFNALSACNPNAGKFSDRSPGELVDQGGFPDTCLTGNKDNLTLVR